MIWKGILLFSWFPVVILFIFVNLFLLNQKKPAPPKLTYNAFPISVATIQSKNQLGTGQVLAAEITAEDGRVMLLNEFLKGTPMDNLGSMIVSLADKYGVDYRIVPAIAMCESNLGKRIPGKTSFNAWGIGVYTGQNTGAKFQDWPQALEWVFQFLHNKFVNKGIVNLQEIGAIWAPPSVEKGHSWANCVETFMRKIE